MSDYMPTRDYAEMDEAFALINRLDSIVGELRERTSAMLPDNGRDVTLADFEDTVNEFERIQRDLIKSLDSLIP